MHLIPGSTQLIGGTLLGAKGGGGSNDPEKPANQILDDPGEDVDLDLIGMVHSAL